MITQSFMCTNYWTMNAHGVWTSALLRTCLHTHLKSAKTKEDDSLHIPFWGYLYITLFVTSPANTFPPALLQPARSILVQWQKMSEMYTHKKFAESLWNLRLNNSKWAVDVREGTDCPAVKIRRPWGVSISWDMLLVTGCDWMFRGEYKSHARSFLWPYFVGIFRFIL